MPSDVWDLAIVGAGPAGAATALRALQVRPDARVLLLDRADFPRDKSCGDGIATHAVDVLRLLGVEHVVAGYRELQSLRMTAPNGATVAGSLPGPSYVIPRMVFDARLVDAAVARGAVLHRRTIRATDVDTTGDLVTIGTDLAARVLVGADGASSVVRRALGHQRNAPKHLAVAIRGYAPSDPDAPMEQLLHTTHRGWPAYAWEFPIGDGTANVGYGEILDGKSLTRADLLARLAELLPHVTVDPTTWKAHHLPLSSQRPRPAPGRVLLVGDALSLINPLTGEGIHYAVLSGMLAGSAAVRVPGDPGSAYAASLRIALGRHLAHMTVVAWLCRDPGFVDTGIAAARRDRRVFHDLADMGLGRGTITARMLRGIARARLTGG